MRAPTRGELGVRPCPGPWDRADLRLGRSVRPRYFKGEARIAATLPPGVIRVVEGEGIRYTRFERARIIGARALQISMGAPILIEVPGGIVDPIDIADIEFRKHVIPITVKR